MIGETAIFDEPILPIFLIALQATLLSAFCYFAFFKYLYGFASFRSKYFDRRKITGTRCAVVIVAYNEEFVVEDTVDACESLAYENKVIVLADDSSDPEIIARRRAYAIARGCTKLEGHSFTEDVLDSNGNLVSHPIDIWESEDFVLLQRPSNTGFKAGSLKRADEYLSAHNINYMYLLDADWHPQPDALERAFEILESDKQIAFVQTKRVSRPEGMSLFQKLVSVMEETCYFVDFEGRQLLGHPVLFSGCCALLRLPYVRQVGGFTPGNLTEDLDLSNRLWLAGKKGAYSGDIVNTGEVPFSYDHYRRQQERWAAGTSHALRKYFFPVFASKVLSWTDKASIFRQNAYYFSNMLTVVAFVTGLFTVVWISVYWGHYSVEYYLLMMSAAQVPISILVYLCVFSTVFGPIVMIVFKKRRYQDLAYLPLSVWYAWSLIYTYFIGNLHGFAGVQTDWFRTPKFNRAIVGNLGRSPLKNRLISGVTCSVFLGFYFLEGWAFGWIDIFAVIWIPSMLIATFK